MRSSRVRKGRNGFASGLNGPCVCSRYRDGLEDPLDDAGLVQQQLDQLSTIGRCEYEKTCALLVQLFDQAAQSYQELLQSTNSNAVDITVQEGTSGVQTQPVLAGHISSRD